MEQQTLEELNLFLEDPEGATPLSPDELKGLKLLIS